MNDKTSIPTELPSNKCTVLLRTGVGSTVDLTKPEQLRAEKVREMVASRQDEKIKQNPFVHLNSQHVNGVALTTEQVARMFGVTTMTVFNWRAKDNLPHYYLEGGLKPPVRYDEGLVLKWAEQNLKPVMNQDYRKWKNSRLRV